MPTNSNHHTFDLFIPLPCTVNYHFKNPKDTTSLDLKRSNLHTAFASQNMAFHVILLA